ncbi:hypothetical protein KC866_01445 [Patescibacteria group bacterium]|nr:hypothetical protein [Patescibacteria group bacterium]
MKYTRDFNQLSKNDANFAGGKGASLGEMLQNNIPVPDGYVVTADTFDHFIKETDLIQEIQAVLDTVDTKAIHTVEDASERIQALIKHAEIPQDIADEVLEQYKNHNMEYVAVRSSATAEDGADHAWAGQLSSYLNTIDENLLEMVQNCWASLFTPRAIFYRFEKELHTTHISVAVVVQKMVNSEKSGIAFSVHPVTEDYNQIIIEAGLGLGEAIVSGSVTPDSYVVTKEPQAIIDINVNTQNKVLYRSNTLDPEHGFNEWKDLSETEANEQVLTEDQIKELSDIIINIENHYGFPCDIEWAFEDNTFYVVQSRPITTLGSVTPLEKKWYQSYNWKVIAGDFNSPYFRNNIWVQAAKFYESDLNLPRLIFGISAKDNDIEYIADMSSWKKAHEQIKERTDNDIYYVENNFIDAVNNFGEKFNQWSQENILEKDLSKFENIELVALYKEFIEKQARLYAYGFSLPVLDFGEFSYFEGNLEKILQNKVSKDEFKEYYKTFTQPYLNSFSQDQDEELLKILAKYETDSDFIKDLKNLSEKEIARKYPDFWNDLENHTKKHTWVYYVYAGPAFSISQFYNFITSEIETSESANEKLKYLNNKRQTLLNKRKKLIKDLELSDFEKMIIEVTGKMVWAKPRRKDYQSQSYYHLELLLNEFANRLNLSLKEVQSLPIKTIEAGLKGEVDEYKMISKNIENRHLLLLTEDNNVELLIGRECDPFYRSIKKLHEEINNSDIFYGNTAYPGFVTGVVRVINRSNEMDKMKDGDILVSIATTPSIVPVMKKAAAIITDEGGLTCHAAIVSRELETPCVVGLKTISKVLKDGDLVEVDADNGIVKILEKVE